MKIDIKQIKKNSWLKSVTALIIIALTSILLLGCCMFYTTGSFKTAMNQFKCNILRSYSSHLLCSGSNVRSYIDHQQNAVKGNIVVQVISQMVPLQTQLVRADNIDFNRYVQQARQEVLNNETVELALGEMKDFLYYNGNIYGGDSDINIQSAMLEDEEKNVKAMSIDIIPGESYMEHEMMIPIDETAIGKKEFFSLDQLSDYEFLVSNCYIVDPTTRASETLFDVDQFMKNDFTFPINQSKPQILIYHTHSQEAFYDSKEGEVEDTIVGVGNVLTDILENEYGINVIHDTTTFDLVDGKLDRDNCYNLALPHLEKILEENPSIEVMIDLHRDGVKAGLPVNEGKRVTTLNGEKCAKIMLFNGLSETPSGPIAELANPNLPSNLAFTFQMYLEGKTTYPDLFVRTYLKPYRFNLHLKERSLLVELGTQYNTVGEAKNSMKYLANLLVNLVKEK